MKERKYPWSSNVNRSTRYLKELKTIREDEGLPTGRIDDELEYREQIESSGDDEDSED